MKQEHNRAVKRQKKALEGRGTEYFVNKKKTLFRLMTDANARAVCCS